LLLNCVKKKGIRHIQLRQAWQKQGTRFWRNGERVSGEMGNLDMSMTLGQFRDLGGTETAFEVPYLPEIDISQSFLACEAYYFAVSSHINVF
jgi:hypothetical protein